MMKKTAMSILLVGLLAACASEKPKEEPKQEAPAPAAQAPQPEATTAEAKTTAPVAAADELNDPSSALAKRNVHYPFDVSVVQEADKPTVLAHAKYLSEHPAQKVRLEGNCDERGSNEYNLGLGQRRANGVKKMFLAGGVKASQIETVSNGEEKPIASGHDEASWAQNRRTDIIYQ